MGGIVNGSLMFTAFVCTCALLLCARGSTTVACVTGWQLFDVMPISTTAYRGEVRRADGFIELKAFAGQHSLQPAVVD